jgi:hypothetical protein
VDECFGCSNEKTTSGLLIDGPTLLHCQCDPKTGAAKANWPTAVFDISRIYPSQSPFNYKPILTLYSDTIVDNANGKLECYGIKAGAC